ncbi:helix-turn-helix domain-containing protein [Actinoplanes sp. CA-142083]|uniref:helix-turn-helix domain-containing protein n=1 Tax=Actinoplanes sp. CA-142083 TaxID=3239903 RepID=UPI003D922DD5
MSSDEGPTLRRRRLGAELKRCREAAGLTQEEVSRKFEWHCAKVTRIETARVAVTPRDVKDLLELYGVADRDYRELLLQLSRPARERAWWSEYRDILPAGSFVSLESEASVLRNWEPVVVPGLLQTEAYMRELYTAAPPGSLRACVDRMVSLRLARQRRLTEDPPLTLRTILDESVIHRRIGGATVMTEQLQRLVAASHLPNVNLRILPHDAGAHPLLGTAVAILEFREASDLDIVYVEQYRGTHHYVKRPAEVARCRDHFERLTIMCLDQDHTIDLIERTLDRQE